MLGQRADILRADRACILLASLLVLGCTGDFAAGPQTRTSPVHSTSVRLPAGTVLETSVNGTTTVSSELISTQVMDVWNLGTLPAGTRVTVDVSGEGNFSVALFDADQVLMINNDRFPSKDPYAALTLDRQVDAFRIAVSCDPYEESYGRYWMTITRSADVDYEVGDTQHVVLNFGGAGLVSVGNMPPVNVPPFDAADLHPSWSEYTELIKHIVMDRMRTIYSGLNVEFYFDDDPDLPAADKLTWIHFGGNDSVNVGLADRVDYGNQVKTEKAIIYTHNFAKYVSSGYDYYDLAQGFANVGAHELGHLLGLNHSDNPADVMNVSPTVAALLAPQYFVESARLDPSVFPAGSQDGAWRIYSTVGGSWSTVLQARDDSAVQYSAYAQSIPSAAAPLHSDTGPTGHERLSSRHPDCQH